MEFVVETSEVEEWHKSVHIQIVPVTSLMESATTPTKIYSKDETLQFGEFGSEARSAKKLSWVAN